MCYEDMSKSAGPTGAFLGQGQTIAARSQPWSPIVWNYAGSEPLRGR